MTRKTNFQFYFCLKPFNIFASTQTFYLAQCKKSHKVKTFSIIWYKYMGHCPSFYNECEFKRGQIGHVYTKQWDKKPKSHIEVWPPALGQWDRSKACPRTAGKENAAVNQEHRQTLQQKYETIFSFLWSITAPHGKIKTNDTWCLSTGSLWVEKHCVGLRH